jgi:uncharacterized membrane protein YfcA
MIFDLTFFLFAITAVIFAGISKGGFGSGAAFAATPFLALILEPGAAVGLMLPLLMVMDVAALRAFWKEWDWACAKGLVLGSVPGIILGAVFFKFTDPDVFRFLIGAVAIAFVLFQIAKKRRWIEDAAQPMSDLAGNVAGAVAGFTSFISHAGGPPAAIFLLSRGLTKTSFQATTVITFWWINMLKVVPYGYLGIFTRDTLYAGLLLMPFAFVGVAVGVYLHRQVSERLFFGLTHAFLLFTGTKLIWDALF